jgi:hypothetical protein
MAKPKKKSDAPLQWTLQGVFVAMVRVKSETLGLVVTQVGSDWNALALETPGEDPSSILESHAHQVVGRFSGVTEAFDACLAYAEKWKIGKRATECGCEEIKKPDSVKCDCGFHIVGSTDCSSPVTMVCVCPRCAREPDDAFHSSDEHQMEAEEWHLTIRERHADWRAYVPVLP